MKTLTIAALPLLALLLPACHSETGLAGRVSAEIKAKHLKTLNDPGSYEVVENQYDSVRYVTYREELLAGIRQNGAAIKENTALIAKSKKNADDVIGYYALANGMAAAQQLYSEVLAQQQKYADARTEAKRFRADMVRDTLKLARFKLTKADIYLVKIKHIYRAKNTAGALQRGVFEFDYFPKRDSLVLTGSNPAYNEAAAAN